MSMDIITSLVIRLLLIMPLFPERGMQKEQLCDFISYSEFPIYHSSFPEAMLSHPPVACN